MDNQNPSKKSKTSNGEGEGDQVQLQHAAASNAFWFEESLTDPERFWGDLAKQRLRWVEPFDTVKKCDMEKGEISWFLGGKLNVSGKSLVK